MNRCKNNCAFDILNNISEHFTLVQLMDTLGNVNNDISIVGHWIFDSNYEKALHLTSKLLNIICSPSVGEEKVVNFETVFCDVIYLCSPGNLNMGST